MTSDTLFHLSATGIVYVDDARLPITYLILHRYAVHSTYSPFAVSPGARSRHVRDGVTRVRLYSLAFLLRDACFQLLGRHFQRGVVCNCSAFDRARRGTSPDYHLFAA